MRLLQLGSEASGNRLMNRILLTAQPALDMRGRSLPHGDEMPEVQAVVDEFKPDKILVMWRERQFQTRAAFAANHTTTLSEAVAERETADWMLARLRGDVRVQVYEWLVKDPLTQVANIADWLGVSLSLPEAIYDANAKHEDAA